MTQRMKKYIPLLVVACMCIGILIAVFLTDLRFLFVEKDAALYHVVSGQEPVVYSCAVDESVVFDTYINDIQRYDIAVPNTVYSLSLEFVMSDFKMVDGSYLPELNADIYSFSSIDIENGKMRIVSLFPFPEDLNDPFYKQMKTKLTELSMDPNVYKPSEIGCSFVFDTDYTVVSEQTHFASTAYFAENSTPQLQSIFTLFPGTNAFMDYCENNGRFIDVHIDTVYVMEYDLGFFMNMVLN